LRAIMETVMLDVMYDIPAMGNVEKCVINGEVVEGKAKPVLMLHSDEAAA